MKKLLALVFVAALVAGCAQSGGPAAGAPVGDGAKESVKIGLLAPLTGDVAPLAVHIKQAAELAMKRANAEGGINGATIELIEEDGQCQPKVATTAAQKLFNVDKVSALVGGFCSGETLAAAPIAQKVETVMVSASSTNPSISDAGEFVFRVVAHDAVQGEDIANHVKRLGFKRPAILYINNDWGVGFRDVLVKEFEENGMPAVAVEAFEQSARDFKTQLTKIREAEPDVLALLALVAEPPVALKQLKEMGMELAVFTGDGSNDQSVIDNAGGAAEGMYNTKSKPNKDAAAQAFEAVYKAEYGEEPGVYANEGFDAANLLIEGLRQGKRGRALNDWLYTVDYAGASGNIRFDGNGDVDKRTTLYQVRNGKFVEVEGQ